MIFTHHAHERYRQFHMLDQPTATDEDARVILEAHGSLAVRLPARTFRDDEVWAIHALGIELVVKRDGDFEEPVCVTVLPPVRFRGLTPLLAEQAEEFAKKASERGDSATHVPHYRRGPASADRVTASRRRAARSTRGSRASRGSEN